MITELEVMMQERLDVYKKKSKALPTRIIVYRDGVSEVGYVHFSLQYASDPMPGTIQHRRRTRASSNKESLPEIRQPKATVPPQAFDRYLRKASPHEILPHRGRLLRSEWESTTRYGCRPRSHGGLWYALTSFTLNINRLLSTDFDFFLQAHYGLQGTVRPTHYYVVHDEIGFKADQLQGLTNAVSYTFARATKAVSLAAPAYYADLACERGRSYLHSLFQGISEDGNTTASGSAGEQEQLLATYREAEKLWHGGPGEGIKDTMFYL
jgi:eukaryotic translation initiation factor 2C